MWLVLLYWPALSGPFVFDDLANVIGNPAIEHFPPNLPWLHAEARPLVMFTFSLEKAMFGQWPAAHRIGNLAIHTAATMLLAELIYRLAIIRTSPFTTNVQSPARAGNILAVLLPITIATLWAVHPLQTQAVAYIVQRCESLMGMFFFAYLLSIVVHQQTAQKRWLVIGAVCFLLGLWSKTVMVTGLAVGPLLDRVWLSGSWREVFAKRSMLYVPPMVAGLIAIATLMPGILRGDANVGFGGDAPPVAPYIAGQAQVIATYVAMSFVPLGLNIDHGLVAPDPWTQNAGWLIGIATLVLVGIGACAKGQWTIGFFLLAPLLVLSPTSSFVPTADLLVEHRMYVPLAAIIAGAVIAAWTLVSGWLQSTGRLRGLAIASVTGLLVLSLLTWRRSHDYESGTRLWYTSILSNPANARAAQNLTSAAREEDREPELLEMFTTALERARLSSASTAVLLGRIGEELVKRGDAAAATGPLRQAIAQDPPPEALDERFYSPSDRQEFASHHINFAISLMQLDQPESAAQHLQQSFDISDASPDARAIAGDLDWRLGKPESAIRHFERALQLRPDWPEVKQQLAHIRSQTPGDETSHSSSEHEHEASSLQEQTVCASLAVFPGQGVPRS